MRDIEKLVEILSRILKDPHMGQVLISVAVAEKIKGILEQFQAEDDMVIKITNMTDIEFCYREINRCKNGIKYSPEVPAKKERWQENLKHFKSIYKLLQGKG